MANDLYARLRLDDSEYNRKLYKAIQSNKDFNTQNARLAEGAKKSMDSIMSVASKTGVALGVAFGAKELFDKFINASQSTADTYANNMNAMRSVTDSFFTSMNTGDFSVFEQGLANIIAKAREYQEALDQLGNTEMSYGVKNKRLMSEWNAWREVVKDKDTTSGIRDGAIKEMERIVKEIGGATANYQKQLRNVVRSGIAASTPLNLEDISISSIRTIAELDVMDEGSKTPYIRDYENYLKERETLEKTYSRKRGEDNKAGGWNTDAINTAEKTALAELAKLHQEGIMYNDILNQKNDETLAQMNAYIGKIDDASSAYSRLAAQTNKLKTGDGESTGNPLLATVHSKTAAVASNTVVPIVPELATAAGDELANLILGGNLVRTITIIPREEEDWEITEFENGKKTPKIDTSTMTAGAGIGAMASMMGMFSSATDDASAAWLSYSSNILGNIGTLITQYGALAVAKAAGEGGPLGWITVGVAAASIIAAIASVPKFATGGIVGGTSYVGDKILARVNSGELILNDAQQRSALALMSAGGSNPTGYTPTVRIKGSDLMIAFRNHEKTRRV